MRLQSYSLLYFVSVIAILTIFYQAQFGSIISSRVAGRLSSNSDGKKDITIAKSSADGEEEKQPTTPDPSISSLTTPSKSSLTVEYLQERLVYVTAISDSHFKEALLMFGSVEHCLPNTTLIVYDLGLSDKNRQYLMKNHHVELRLFPFNNYSHLPHVKNLFSYAWKPIMVQMLVQEYNVILYLDSSIRMKSCDIKPSLSQLLKFPFFDLAPYISHFIEFAHEGMLKYLQYPKHRRDVAHINVNLRAGCWIMWVNDIIRKKLIKPWLDCALHKECIAPEGAPCRMTSIHDGRYIGCHRYDQSALNVIIAREFGMNAGYKAINLSISDSTWDIEHIEDLH